MGVPNRKSLEKTKGLGSSREASEYVLSFKITPAHDNVAAMAWAANQDLLCDREGT